MDAGFPGLRQKTNDACGETAAFAMTQNTAVVLPVLSESQRLMWVNSNQIDLQVDGVAELEKAFDGFPYLTQEQTAALAQHCSLHLDQVKVWFMLQRLRYGISWDYEDIQEAWRKFSLSQGKVQRNEELQSRMEDLVKKDRGEKKKQKRNRKKSGGVKAGNVREEQSTNEGRMMGENVKATERIVREMKQQLMKAEDGIVEKIEEDRRKTQRKRKRVAVANKTGKKRMKQGDNSNVERAGEIEIKSGEGEKKSQKKKKTNRRMMSVEEWPIGNSFLVPDESLDVSSPPLCGDQTELMKMLSGFIPTMSNISVTPEVSGFDVKPGVETWLGKEPHTKLTNNDIFVTDLHFLKELGDESINCIINCSSVVTPQPGSNLTGVCSRPATVTLTKRQVELMMMKMAFTHCQYPNREIYERLAKLISIPRQALVQWFGDMRYAVKRARPRWMSVEQHCQALTNIKYQQLRKKLLRAWTGEGRKKKKAKWKGKIEKRESPDEGEGVKLPPEEK